MAAVLSETHASRAGEARTSALFRRDIAPHLADLERRRRQQRRRYLLVVVGMLAGIFLAFLTLQDLHYALVAGVIVFAGGCVLLQVIQRSYTDQVRRTVMPAVCERIGGITHAVGQAPDVNFDELEQIGLVPRHNRRRIDDVFQGRHRATGFTMAEVRLRRERRTGKRSSHTVFRGLIFAIEVPRAIPGRILIARDGGLIGNSLKEWIKRFRGMQRVALPHHAFETSFELYADRPDLARDIVSPALCDNLLALAAAHDGAPFQAAFAERRFFLALPSRADQFRIGSLFRSTDALESEVAQLFQEVQIVHRLIDYLHGDRPPLESQPVEAARPKPASSSPVQRC